MPELPEVETVKEILNLCEKLAISVSKEDDMLSEDDIIMLDNEIASSYENEEDEEDTYDLQKELEAKFDELFGPLDD